MSTLEERLAYLEGRMEDQATLGTNLRNDVRDLRAAMSDLRADMNKDFAEVRAELKKDFVELRADMARQTTELRTEMAQYNTELRTDMARQFAEVRAEMRSDRHWLVGLLTTTAVAIGCAVIGLYFK